MKICVFVFLVFAALATDIFAERSEFSHMKAYYEAEAQVPKEMQNHVISIYGEGSPMQIDTWVVTFLDPASQNRAEEVLVKRGHVNEIHPITLISPISDDLTFDPESANISVSTVLATTANYADQKGVFYDGARVWLKKTSAVGVPVWTVEMLADNRSRGFVSTSATDGSFANFLASSRAGIAIPSVVTVVRTPIREERVVKREEAVATRTRSKRVLTD
jgi:hypothetical protein